MSFDPSDPRPLSGTPPVLSDSDLRKRLLAMIHMDRPAAHRLLFARQHTSPDAPFHDMILRDFYSPHPRVGVEAFRGAAKSTKAEEWITVKTGLNEFRYALIIGNTYDLACKRLSSIKRHMDQNPYVYLAFGDLRGAVWNEGRCELVTGAVMQAFGARQSIRGAKEEIRPDLVLIDDLEDKEMVRSQASIDETMSWLLSELLPALADPLNTPVRVLGTPLAENAMIEQLSKDPDWTFRTIPVRYLDDNGDLQSSWPGKFSLEDIAKLEQNYIRLGKHREFMQEYMCQSESQKEKVFTANMMRCAVQVKTWQATGVMIDPARTTNTKTSAMTGWAAWSWSGSKLVVWEADGGFLKPDEIIDTAFRLNEMHRPVHLGFEEDGLNEWALQPLRAEMTRRGALPLRPMKAPKGKIDFIAGLQHYASKGDLVFAGEREQFATAIGQFLSFPRGLIDIPNALAYATEMLSGQAVYPDFTTEAIFEGTEFWPYLPAWLGMNSDGYRTTGVMVQDVNQCLRVIGDWVIDGPPSESAGPLIRQASALARGTALNVVIGHHHFDRYRNMGLAQAIQHVRLRASAGTSLEHGRRAITGALQRRLRGFPAIMVGTAAHWTLNGFNGGYARAVLPGNLIARDATEGVYRTLMEGLETLAGAISLVAEEEMVGNFRETADGRRYRSALRQ